MSLQYSVLGNPGDDNALFVKIDDGQSITRLLFDCGHGCADSLELQDTLNLDAILFSHLHMDHVGGFDYVFRCLFQRASKPNIIWGPQHTAAILQHRFRGFLWNLHGEMTATWEVRDLESDLVRPVTYELKEAFEYAHPCEPIPWQRTILDRENYSIEAMIMDHHTPSIAYFVREKPKLNIDLAKASELGLKPGPWMKALKDPLTTTEFLDVGGKKYPLVELRQELLKSTSGDSIAYVTDFLLDGPTIDKLASWLTGCRTIVCEAQYTHADHELARRNHHMTTHLAGKLAAACGAEQLILFHLSDRYQTDEWQNMLAETRVVFPNTSFPKAWNL